MERIGSFKMKHNPGDVFINLYNVICIILDSNKKMSVILQMYNKLSIVVQIESYKFDSEIWTKL